MKIILFGLLVFLCIDCYPTYSQCPTQSTDITANPFVCGLYGDAADNINWNWELPSSDPNYCAQWDAHADASATVLVQMGSPFVNASTGTLALIAENQDYTRVKGWELLRRDFGCTHPTSYPYFVLYNRYSGLMRIFIYQNQQTLFSSMSVQITPVEITYPATTASGDPVEAAPDKYLSTNASSTIGKNIYAVSDDLGGSNRWTVINFQPSFDKNIASYTNASLAFKIWGVNQYNLQATIGGSLVSTSGAGLSFAPKTAQTTNGSTTVVNTSNENFTTFSKNIGDLLSSVSTAATQISSGLSGSDPKSTQGSIKSSADNANTVANSGSDFTAIFSAVAGVLTGGTNFLKLAGAVVGFFTGSKSTPGATPAYTSVNLTLTGTMTLNDVAEGFVLKVPGAPSTDGNNLTYYQCPLGIFNIDITPSADTLRYDRPEQWINSSQSAFGRNRYTAYRISNNISVTYNDGAGLDLLSVKAAIMGRIGAQTTTGNATYNPLQQNLVNTDPNDLVLMNFMLPEFQAGRLQMTVYDPSAKHLHLFQTPYVNLECFQGTSINVPDLTDVFVRIQAIMKRKDDPNNTPILFVQDYSMDRHQGTLDQPTRDRLATSITALPPYAAYSVLPSFNADRTITNMAYTAPATEEADNSITAGPGVTISPSAQSVVFEAGHAVYLQQGFTAPPGSHFVAQIDNYGYTPPACGTLLKTAFPSPGNCYNAGAAPQSRKTDTLNGAAITLSNPDSSVNIYPNPAQEMVTITGLNGWGHSTVTVLDQSGRILYTINKTDDSPTMEINVGSLTSGVYLIEIQGTTKKLTHKIIIAR
jgi:hypothetical protein